MAIPLGLSGAIRLWIAFWKRWSRAGCWTAPQLKGFLAERPGLRAEDTSLVADALVAQGLLTDYQMQWLLAGEPFGLVLGNYRVLDWLGSGGMGVVYKAEHTHMKRPVALKVLAAEIESNAVFLERFTSEMQALATLRHPNIVEAFDAGEVVVPSEPGKSLRYLVMEFVQGVDLERFVTDHGPLPIAVACDYIRQAANGLHHAHERGMVHRDVKPSNLLVTDIPGDHKSVSGAPWPHGQLKILDFGLARSTAGATPKPTPSSAPSITWRRNRRGMPARWTCARTFTVWEVRYTGC